ncbi:MAG TPA: DNA-processing protein DprA [Rectinemataceae bacterium]|nr:DNA-processing protein DprA [Rectinemataceae bacterium]
MSSLATKLAIHRIGFLRPPEKRLLEAAIEAGLDLSSLSFSGLEKIVGRLIRSRDWHPSSLSRAAEADLRFLEARGIRYIALGDPEYPPLLGEIHDPPFGLFVRGSPLPNDRPSLAMVGTRTATGKGLSLAVDIAREAALAGIPVISGLARGIDAASHRGALAARSRDPEAAATLAVLPVGIDSVYPPSHRGLAAAILEKGGSLVSEYPPGEGPRTWRFPERNRIIAGIARATLVVEAPADSGALITANHALDAGRDVWVAGGRLGSPMDAGADRLAAEGAPTLSSLDELLADWGFSFHVGAEPGEGRQRRGGGLEGRNEDGARSLAAELRDELGLETT